jgi:hypothetical protein
MKKAPFPPPRAYADSAQERRLRRYFGAFGLFAPPRLEPDRPKTDACLAQVLPRIFKSRPRPSILYLWSTPPSLDRQPALKRALSNLPRRVDLRWISMQVDKSLPRAGARLSESVADALEIRLQVARSRGERSVRQLGFRVVELNSKPRISRPSL